MGILEVFDLLPHLRDLERFDISDFSVEPLKSFVDNAARILIPVAAIRFTHDVIDGRATFADDCSAESLPPGDQPSIYSTLDQLLRGVQTPEDLPPLELVLSDGKLWSLNSRCLAVLKMLQALDQEATVWASCIVRPPHHHKFASAESTVKEGLSVRFCRVSSQQAVPLDAAVFNQAAQAEQAFLDNFEGPFFLVA